MPSRHVLCDPHDHTKLQLMTLNKKILATATTAAAAAALQLTAETRPNDVSN